MHTSPSPSPSSPAPPPPTPASPLSPHHHQVNHLSSLAMASPAAQNSTPLRDTAGASLSPSTAPTSSTSSPSFSPSDQTLCPLVSSKPSPADTLPAPASDPVADVDIAVPDDASPAAATTERPTLSPAQSTTTEQPALSSTPPPTVAIPLPAPPPPALPTSSSSPSLPSSAQPQPRLAPPPPPAFPPFTPTLAVKRADSDQLTPYLGPYDGFQRAAARQSRWMVVVVCSTATPALTATTTTTTGVVRRRYISNSRPLKMHKEVVGLARNAPLLLWRRTATSTDLEKYSAFYPIDAYPHIALLDSRTGERMQVWNFEPDVVQEWEDKRKQQKEEMEKAKEMESGKKSDEQSADNPSTDVAVTVEQNEETENGKNEIKEDENEEEEDEELPVPVWMTELEDFLESHSLKDDEVGPMHLGEKPAAARTRRVDSSRGASSSAAAAELQPTSIMDDEEAAIAAAIAASLKDVEGVASSDYEVEEEEDDEAEDQGDDNDENNDTDNAPCDEDVMADENGTEIMSVQPPTAQVLQPDDDGDDTMHDSTPSSADAATAAEGQTVSAMMDVEQSPETAVAEQAMDVVVDGDGDNDDEQQRLQTQASEQRVEEDNEQEQSEREGEDDNSSESDASMDSGLASTSTSTTRAPTGARTKPVPMPAAKPAASFSSSSSSSSSSSVFLKPGSDTSGTPPTAVPGKTPSRTFGPQPHTTGGAARTSSPRLASSVESVSSSYLERLSSTLRSSTDPALLESRRLRRMQDEELQASLQSDRAREAKLHQLNMAHARRRAAVMNAQARLAQVSSGPVEIVLRFNDGTRERRAFASDVMMRTLMDVIVVVTQGNCVCLGDEDVEFGGEDNVSVDRVLRYPLGGGRMPPMMMQKMGADAGQGMDLAQVSWDHRVVDVIKGNRAAFFVQS